MERKDRTLLAIGCVKEGTLSPVQLQKSLFLFDRLYSKKNSEEFYKFIPYNYGPFCQDIYRDAESLALEGLIVIRRPMEKRWIEYSITNKSTECCKKLQENIAQEAYAYLCEIANWARSMTFQQLVRSIYNKFPEFRANSVFQET